MGDLEEISAPHGSESNGFCGRGEKIIEWGVRSLDAARADDLVTLHVDREIPRMVAHEQVRHTDERPVRPLQSSTEDQVDAIMHRRLCCGGQLVEWNRGEVSRVPVRRLEHRDDGVFVCDPPGDRPLPHGVFDQ